MTEPMFPPAPPVPPRLVSAFEARFRKPAAEMSERERLLGATEYLAAHFGVDNAMSPFLND